MYIRTSKGIYSKVSNFVFAFGIVKGVKVFGPNEETNKILTEVYPQVKNKYNLENLKSDPHSVSYINFSKSIGVSPDSAFLPYLQIKRILKGGSIGNINNIVNQYMALEIMYNLSLAAYDLDTIKGTIEIGLARGGEKLLSIGGHETVLKPGDLIFSDENGVFYSFSEGYRDSSKITANSTNILFTVDAPSGVEKSTVESCIKDLVSKFNSKIYVLFSQQEDSPQYFS